MKKYFTIIAMVITLPTTVLSYTYPTITEIDTAIDSLMKQINIDSLEYYIRYQQDLGPRPSKNPPGDTVSYLNNIAAKEWLHKQYKNMRNLAVSYHHFLPKSQCDSFVLDSFSAYGVDTLYYDTARNVVAVQLGTEYPDEYVIVCSHFDTGYGSPGADDNASGTAGVIEIARVLSKHKFKRSIVYLNNNAEETGLWGSRTFAGYCRHYDINILGVFNLDMIGYNPISMPLAMFYSERDVGEVGEEFEKYYDEVANLYLPDIPTIQSPRIGSGDALSFTHFNYPAIYIGDILGQWYSDDYYENPCYHQSRDTIGIGKEYAGVNSMELVRAYTQATLSAIVELTERDTSFKYNAHNIRVAPNPTDNDFNVIFDNTENQAVSIELIDIEGKIIQNIFTGIAPTGRQEYPVNVNLLSGAYLVKFTTKDKVVVRKLVVYQ
jgi:hypothetical protein